MNLFELYAKISVDDSNFKKSMENAQKVSKNVAKAVENLQSPLDNAKSRFEAIKHPVETAKANFEKLKNSIEKARHPIENFKSKVADSSIALETQRIRLSYLSESYNSAKTKVDELTKEFVKSSKESGTASKQTKELAEKLKDAESEAANAKKEMDDFAKSVSEAGKNSGSAKDKIAGLVGGLGKVAHGLGTDVATAAKVGAAAVGAASTGIAVLTKSAVDGFAEYEQLAGGAAKIFDEMNQADILRDAQNAYKDLGLSANQYLAVINDVGATFAATMGDAAGYEAAKTGLKAISDYASGTGKNVDELSQKFTLITRSTASYQSIADQFSGILPATSSGFLEQAQAAGILSDSYTQLTEVPIDEYQEAVSKMLEKGVADLGLANNTMDEAFSTLSGSLAMAKGAWSNLVTGLADDSADLDMLIGNFVESVGAVATNLIPKIGTALNGVSELISELVPVIVQEIPILIEENLPILSEAAVSIIKSLVDGISQNQGTLFETIFEVITYLAESFVTMLPQIVELGLDLIVSLANGIAESLPEMIPTIVDVVLQIVDTLIDNVDMLVDAAIEIILALADGLIEALPDLIDAIPTIIEKLVEALIENAPEILSAGLELSLSLIEGIISIIPNLLETSKTLAKNLAEYITNPENIQKITDTATDLINGLIEGFNNVLDSLISVGRDVVDSIKKGISDAWDGLKKWFNGIWDSLFGDRSVNVNVKKSGPSNDDNNNQPPVDDSAADGLYYVPFDGFIAELHKGERVLTAREASAYNKAEINGNTSGITIIQNIQAVPQTPVEFAAATQAYFEQARWAFA